jgi:Family of unknown function (DUF6491)
MKMLLPAAVLMFLVAAPAFAANDVCLYRHDVDGWGARSDHSMIINDRFGRKYLVNLAGICSDLNFSFGAGIRPIGGFGGPCVERGDHVITRGPGSTHTDVCWITKIRPYTKDMEVADRHAREEHQPPPAF